MAYKTQEQKKEYNRKWYQNNKNKVKEKSNKHYHENKEEIQAAKHQKRVENIDEAREKDREYAKNYRENNRESILQYKKEWYASHKEDSIDYREKNEERIKLYNVDYYKDHRDDKIDYQKNYNQEHKEEIALKKEQYYLDNKDKIITKAIEYFSANKLSPKRRFSAAKAKAKVKKRGLSWTINYEQYCDLIVQSCYYCENQLGNTKENCGVGLDRLDNSKGYELSNVVSCCGTCNIVRSDKLSPEETKVAIQAVVEFRGKFAEKIQIDNQIKINNE